MTDQDFRDRKENRKHNIGNRKKKSPSDISEEQRFLSKSKKAFRNKKQEIREEEIWEDWNEDY